MDWQLSADVQPSARIPEAQLRAERTPVPVTGAWRPGDPIGDRRFVQVGDLETGAGATIADLRIAYESWGELNEARDNAVLVLHALTGDSHVVGEAGPGHPTGGWWGGLIGPGAPLDTDRWFVVAPNMLGGCQGTTGPASPGEDGVERGSRFPWVTIRDQVTAQVAFADALGIDRWHAVVGGSMGGMHALEWGIAHGDRVARLAVLAAPPASTADQIALNIVQIEAVRNDPNWLGGDYYDQPEGEGPTRGLALARRMALLNYRSGDELNARFGREWQSGVSPLAGGGRFAVESYLDFHGNKFTRRFDAGSYVRLVHAMNTHDVGRGRGGVEAALERIRARTLVLGITTDRLFPLEGQREIARGIRSTIHGDQPIVLDSEFGHDAFLIETERVGALIRALVDDAPLPDWARRGC